MSDLFTDTTKVFVAIYEHKHGHDTCVFRTAQGAQAWKDQLASDWWEDAFADEEPPSENIGDEYFRRMTEIGGEYFDVEEHTIIEE